jgi:hypothetical protein
LEPESADYAEADALALDEIDEGPQRRGHEATLRQLTSGAIMALPEGLQIHARAKPAVA